MLGPPRMLGPPHMLVHRIWVHAPDVPHWSLLDEAVRASGLSLGKIDLNRAVRDTEVNSVLNVKYMQATLLKEATEVELEPARTRTEPPSHFETRCQGKQSALT